MYVCMYVQGIPLIMNLRIVALPLTVALLHTLGI